MADTKTVGRVWTTTGDCSEVEVDLVAPGGVYFETATGIVHAYVDEGEELCVCSGERGYRLLVRPWGEDEIDVSVEPMRQQA
jgi:hypothetical protein